ncbi:hypothetical protein ACFX1Z_001706 [Malus domestica]
MLMNPNMGFGVFLLETLKTFLTMMIMEFRIMIHPEQQGRICCLCQQGGKVRYSFRHVFMVACHFPRTFNCCCIVEYLKNDQNLDVVLGEAVAVDGASVHSSDVVYAAFELRLRSLVVVSYPHCLFHHF